MDTPTPETKYVLRPEFNLALEAIRREICAGVRAHADCRGEISAKLDAIIASRMDEARSTGGLEAKVDQLIDTIGVQNAEIEKIREIQAAQGREIEQIRQAQRDGPSEAKPNEGAVTMRDVVRVLFGLGKLLATGVIGYLLGRLK